ncbi:hypothetical protein NEMBOFW57_004239 [Staphylotrichum longicolle]|uniref:Uncharacterized protein n=1 Tax=Staphylotrichum longicolle TaxID=669026 RepID=A0AAD4F7P8_9PEZI|nr:hypothetical protein NEMBOFW57_004239 [Staphylotrichum longicolle]
MAPSRAQVLTPLILTHLLLALPLPTLANPNPNPNLPFVINTWSGPFTAATDAAFDSLLHPAPNSSTPALDALVHGCAACERAGCDGTVGAGGSPDEACETTLDAMVMDGTTMNSGAVAGLRRIRDAVAVARAVLEHTRHSLLVGDLATAFAVAMGFGPEGDLGTAESRARCETWRAGGCQGNYWVGVEPDPGRFCGPYRPVVVAVENLRRGMTPTEAAEDAVRRILRKYPKISSGIVVVNNKGEHGGAGSGWTFSYSFRGGTMAATKVVNIPPLEDDLDHDGYDSPSEI